MAHANGKVCKCGARAYPHRPDLLCAVWSADQKAGWDEGESNADWDAQELACFDRAEAAAINQEYQR